MTNRNQVSFISKNNINLDETTNNDLISMIRTEDFELAPSLHENVSISIENYSNN